jgi:hypothetical protein
VEVKEKGDGKKKKKKKKKKSQEQENKEKAPVLEAGEQSHIEASSDESAADRCWQYTMSCCRLKYLSI